jgi:hypothetical protein
MLREELEEQLRGLQVMEPAIYVVYFTFEYRHREFPGQLANVINQFVGRY